MANGFFLGGMAQGMQAADKQGTADRTLAADTALRTRGYDISEKNHADDIALRKRALDITEGSAKRAEGRELLTKVESSISSTMGIVDETIKGGLSAGKDPALIQQAVKPLVDSIKSLGARIGKDPNTYDAMVNARLFQTATPAEAGTAEGVKEGTKAVAKTAELTKSGVDPNAIADPVKKVQAENALRDDFTKAAGPYTTIRDAKNRLDVIEKTGAGDVALVFQYMKILDPGSTVREGEFATASNAAGVPASIIAQYNKVIGDGVLAEPARKQIISQANKIYQAAAAQHDKTQNQYANIAKRQGLDPNNVIINLSPAGADNVPPPPPGFLRH